MVSTTQTVILIRNFNSLKMLISYEAKYKPYNFNDVLYTVATVMPWHAYTFGQSVEGLNNVTCFNKKHFHQIWIARVKSLVKRILDCKF